MTVYVPVVLTADEAKAAANACAFTFTKMAALVDLDHPVFTAALAIEDAMAKAGLIELERHKRENA